MPRPHKPRIVCQGPAASYFKPRGIPLQFLEETVLGLDELEGLRLADVEGLSQEDAGKRMGVSRGTIGRLLERAHRIVADALLNGKALRLEGGPIAEPPRMRSTCPQKNLCGCPGMATGAQLPKRGRPGRRAEAPGKTARAQSRKAAKT